MKKMDKKALLDYALFARKSLEEQIALSLNRIGIFKDKIARANIVGDFTIIEGINENFPKRIYNLREEIINNHIKENSFDSVVEEFAYTWFNRIIALRFMEVHGYFSHGFRVLTSPDGSAEPEILSNLNYVKDDLKLDDSIIEEYRNSGNAEGLYRYVLFAQCNALSKSLPMLFDVQSSYMELFLPNNLLSKNSVIGKITEIPEEDFKNDVEVIGWLYQFYNSVKKDEVFASKKTITKDTLPAVTQLFTPEWIVRYMAQNSIGRLWLELYPNSSLKQEMKYYVEDAKQTTEVEKEIQKIKYKNFAPEDIKIIEPCCGSGHILVYAFDLLFKMYFEMGYPAKDIPAYIFKHNLYGLDVDKRAVQLSQFSLMMKARSIDNKFFDSKRIIFPKVYEIIDSQQLLSFNYKEMMKDFKFSEKSIKIADYLVNTFINGKVIGSLLKVKPDDYDSLIDEINSKDSYIANILETPFKELGLPELKKIAILAKVLSSKYDVMITNPPYCGISSLEKACKDYAIKEYPDSKTDMFAMFMETNLVKKNGFLAMINMQSWMFLASYEKLRKHIIQDDSIITMIHLGPHAFESIGGEVVQTTSFVIRNTPVIDNGVYFRLVDSKDKEHDFLSQNAGGGK